MLKLRCLLVLLFIFEGSIGLADTTNAADQVERLVPASSDTMKFKYMGLPLGTVTFHYGKYLDTGESWLRSETDETKYGSTDGGDKLKRIEDSEASYEGSSDYEYASQLGAISGQTNGLVRWIKRYSGHYETHAVSSGIRYRVDAIDQGVSEYRDILFPYVEAGIPVVQAFKDRSGVEYLRPRAQIDTHSLDPVSLLRTMLNDVRHAGACPKSQTSYKIYDGKRRYRAKLAAVANSSEEKEAQTADTTLLESGGDLAQNETGRPSAPSRSAARYPRADVVSTGETSPLGSNNSGFGTHADRSQKKRKQLPLSHSSSISTADSESWHEFQIDNVKGTQFTCRLMLAVIAGEFSDYRQTPAKSADHSGRQHIGSLDSGFESECEYRSDLRSPENDDCVLHQESEISRQKELGPKFWPFNVSELEIDLTIGVAEGALRYRSFKIKTPLGMITGGSK